MTVAVDCLLAAGVFASWLGVIAFIRMPTPLQRLHAVSLINVASATPIVVAALLSDGFSSRVLKCLFMLFFVVFMGALLAHVTGRALHFGGGERQ